MEVQEGIETMDPASVKRLELVELEGIPLPETTVKRWDAICSFKARPDDLLICTYPKAGTTWMQEIVDMIHQGGDPQKCARAPIYKRIPFIEMCPPQPIRTGFEEAEAMPSPRTLKTHLPVHLLPPSFWEQNCKIIYVARNIKDNAVSYFHFHRMSKLMPDPGNWVEFQENFIAGKVAWGSWFDHVQGWWEAKTRHPILYVFYEDIKKDPAQEIQKVAQFLGLELSEAVLGEIVQHTKFESMKTNPMTNYSTIPSFLLDQDLSPFMRKGNSMQLTAQIRKMIKIISKPENEILKQGSQYLEQAVGAASHKGLFKVPNLNPHSKSRRETPLQTSPVVTTDLS